MFNKCILMGNLTRDPELKYTPKGTAVCNFDIAMNRKWKNDSGESQEEVTFVNITFWSGTAEVVAQYFKKGRLILVEGRLRQENWEDKNTGKKMSRLTVIGETFSFTGQSSEGREEGEERPDTRHEPQERRTTKGKKAQPEKEAAEEPEPAQPDDADDVPF